MIGFELFVQWTVFFLMVGIMAARRQLTIFHPTSVYLAFHAIVFCIRPTMVHFFDFDMVWNYMQFTPTDTEMARALYLSSAGLIVFCVAFILTCPHPGPKHFGGKYEFSPEEKKSFWLMVLLVAPLGVLSIVASDMQGEHVGGVYIMTGTSGYLNDLQQVLIPITVLIVVMCRWKVWAFVPLLAFLYHRASLGWGRWTIILTFFTLVLLYSWEKRKDLPSLKFLVPLPLIFVLFANLGLDRAYFRNLVTGNQEDIRDVLEEGKTIQERFDNLDFANFDYLTYIVAVVPEKTETYTYASQYLQIFTEPIPRKLWKNKPAGAPIVFFDLNDYGNFLGLTHSLVGDGWLSGGWIGALLTMALAGWGLGLLYNWFINNQHNMYFCFIFLITNAMIVQLFRDGGISITKFLLFCLFPVFVWMFIAKYIFPTPLPAEEDQDEDWLEEEEYEEEVFEDNFADEPDEQISSASTSTNLNHPLR